MYKGGDPAAGRSDLLLLRLVLLPVLRLLLLEDLLAVVLDLLAVPHVLVHLLLVVVVIVVGLLLLVGELYSGVRLALDHELLLVPLLVEHPLPVVRVVQVLRQAHQLRDLPLALLERLLHGLVAHFYRGLAVELDRDELLTQVVDARLDVDQHLRLALELALIPVELLRCLAEVVLEVVDRLPPAHVAPARELELLHLQPEPPALLCEPVDRGLVLLGEVREVLLRVLLREELLDHLVHVADARRLLDRVQGLLVVLQLLPLLVGVLVRDARREVRGGGHLLQLTVGGLVGVLLLLQHLLALLEALVHLDALLHQRLLLLHLLVALVALLHDPLLEAVQLGLGHLLRVVRVVGEEQQLLVVALLRLQRALDGGELVVEADPLLLELLHDRLVRLPDALGLVVLDHGLVEPVLEHADLPHLGRRLAGVHLGAQRKLLELDVELVQVRALLVVLGLQHVVLPLQGLDVRHGPLELLLG
mmetsp:Transcript_82093/g.232719  ORF Transcript_82093/g.232719 Transcript_82093/m.232719 type:complete len:476 (+) Transcript_82093:77-1504(+)